MGQLRVLFVTPFYEPAWVYGGVARANVAWARTLAATGVSVSVWTTTADGDRELQVPKGTPIECSGVQVTYYSRWRWSGNGFVSPDLLRACWVKLAEYDIVHAVGLWTLPSVAVTFNSRREGVPYVISLHGMLMPWARRHHGFHKGLLYTCIERPRLARANAVICTSEMEKQHFAALGINNRAEVVPNVVDVADVVPVPARFRERYNLKDAFVMLFAGRIVENKGVHLTLAAFARIAGVYPDACLVIVGPAGDDSARKLRYQVQALGLENRVCFTGLLNGADYWDALAGADLFVLNSYSENFGMAPAEALALGVPVLVSDQVGISHLVEEYGAGRVAPLDVDTITQAMGELLAQRTSLHEMGQKGVRLVRDQFSPSVVGRRFARLLEDVVRERQSQAKCGHK